MSDRLEMMSFALARARIPWREFRTRDFSEASASVIDTEVQRLLREADQRAEELLSQHREDLDRLVEALLQREELLKDEIEALLDRTKPSEDGVSDKVFAPGSPK